MATKTQVNEFIKTMWNACKGIDFRGLYVSVAIAQAAIESSWGQNWFSQKYNNYFGIKADASWTGKKASAYTHEVVNGASVGQYSYFRVYDSVADSVRDYVKFINKNSRYKKNGVFNAASPQAEADALQKAGYATATNYASTIKSIIATHNLEQYDEKKKHRKTAIIITIIGIIVFTISYKKWPI